LIQATLHQLKVFEATARHGSFTKAAEELFITQPTVSSQIKKLSQTVGLALFEQIGKRLYLTEAGQELLEICQEIFEKLDNFEMKVANVKGKKQGKLRISAIATAKYIIPRILGSFCQQYPGIDVSLNMVNHQEIQKRMMENQDDLYILSQAPDDIPVSCQSFLDNPLVVVAKYDHPLVHKTNIPIQYLHNQPFIMREVGSETRSALQKLLIQHKIAVDVRLELSSNEAIKQAIAGGLGISILSKYALSSDSSTGELRTLDVQYFPIKSHWHVAHLAGKKLSVIAQTFWEYLLAESYHLAIGESVTTH
jgi:LysR family transcriptional regulator, low CO2-responsive transcriptional regulator